MWAASRPLTYKEKELMSSKTIAEPERTLVVEVGEHLAATTPYKVQILWGEHPEDDYPICEYRFATEAELEAFVVGAEAAEGWMGYTVID